MSTTATPETPNAPQVSDGPVDETDDGQKRQWALSAEGFRRSDAKEAAACVVMEATATTLVGMAEDKRRTLKTAGELPRDYQLEIVDRPTAAQFLSDNVDPADIVETFISTADMTETIEVAETFDDEWTRTRQRTP